MPLYPHQQAFLDKNLTKALICFETGTGKTRTAVEWLRRYQGNAWVIVPKRIKKKWQVDLSDVKATVVTKEEFKKLDITNPTALIIDEAHAHASALFTKGRSQLAEHTYNLIRKYPQMPVLLLTATPISSTPANLHTLLTYTGVYIPWPTWRDRFYNLERLPYLPRPAYIPKKDWRQLIQPVLLQYAHVALMKDCVDVLPPITEEIISVPAGKFKVEVEWEPMAAFVAEHRHEQTKKAEKIREIGVGYRKVVVVAYFREQIEELEKELKKDKTVYVLHGGVADQEAVIKQAQEDEECFLICQSSIGAGFDLNTFAIMIFASQGYSYLASVQMKGRIRRIHDLKPVKYIYLLGGRIDRAIKKRIELGKDFDPTQLAKNLQEEGGEDNA